MAKRPLWSGIGLSRVRIKVSNRSPVIEHHLDVYGSVVPKHPDVWGEARMTRHREEVEKHLADQLETFDESLQGAIRRSDQAALSLALNAAAAVEPATVVIAQQLESDSAAKSVAEGMIEAPAVRSFSSLPADRHKSQDLSLEPVKLNDQRFRYLNALNHLRRINEGDDTADGTGYAMNLVRIPVSVLPGSRTRTGYGCEVTLTAEPILGDDLLPNTFRDLIINDVVDMHGLTITRFLSDDSPNATEQLSLHAAAERRAAKMMVLFDKRIEQMNSEVMVNSGIYDAIKYAEDDREYLRLRFEDLAHHALSLQLRKTSDKQYPIMSGTIEKSDFKAKVDVLIESGALLDGIEDLLSRYATVQEVTISITPEPNGCSGSVQLKPIKIKMVFGAIEDKVEQATRRQLPYYPVYPLTDLIAPGMQIENQRRMDLLTCRIADEPKLVKMAERLDTDEQAIEALKKWLANETCRSEAESFGMADAIVKYASQAFFRQWGNLTQQADGPDPSNPSGISFSMNSESLNAAGGVSLSSASIVLEQQINATTFAASPTAPARSRRIRRPLTPSQYLPVIGYESFFNLAMPIASALNKTPPNDGNYVLVSDVRSILKEELIHTCELLCQPTKVHLWQHASPELAEAITTRNFKMVRSIRESFLSELGVGVRFSPTSALAWSLIVEASLLNRELLESMKRLESEKGVACGLAGSVQLQFHGPDPSPEAREAFNQYVLNRWPIQVFALDPNTQEQNIADSFNLRRELQLAAAVAIATGNASVRAAGNFARQLEVDIDTIDVNATEVAFAHGTNVFGWRFYPRLQSPDNANTLRSISQTLLGGPSRDRLLSSRRLEPGQRECTAVIVMPSFVPYMNLHSRTSWFRITNPADRELTLTDTMKLSRASEAVHQFTQCVPQCDCYRPADVAHLSSTANQLSQRLPLQSSIVQIPFESSVGGFELVSGGIGDLAVELTSWYGAPGIDPKADTTLFLVGEGFSVHETQVVVGGKVAKHDLLSRQIMKVTVPKGVQSLGRGQDSRLVDVHVATPYGVSSHLMIPLNEPEKKPTAAKVAWNPASLQLAQQISRPNTVPKLGDLTFVGGGTVSIKMPKPEDVVPGAKVSVQLLTDTPLGLAICSGAENPFDLVLKVEADKSRYVVDPSSIAYLNSQMRNAIKGYVEGRPAARSMRLLVRGEVKVGEKSQGIPTDLVAEITLLFDPPAKPK